jgi:replicative DNA helicase
MPFSEVAERLAYLEAGLNPLDHDRNDPEQRVIMEETMWHLDEYPIHITSVGSIAVRHLVAKVRRHHELHGSRLLIVDTFQKLRGDGDNAEQRARDGITALKGLAIDLDIPVIAVSHISRDSARNALHEQRRISVHDALHSGAIEQESDQVIALEPVHYDRDRWKLLTDAQFNKFQSERRWVPIEFTLLKHRQGSRVSAQRLLSWQSGGRFEPIVNEQQGRLPT